MWSEGGGDMANGSGRGIRGARGRKKAKETLPD